MEYLYELKIPKERVAVLIGKDGSIKKEIEGATHSKISVDSSEGDVMIKGDDSLGLFTAKQVVTAIARGFNPEFAMLLLKQDYCFELINISDYAGKSKAKVMRLRGRVIGKEGKTRQLIEELTESYITIYGKTIGIIGYAENIDLARRAVDKLLGGAEHSTVYSWLEKKRKDLKRNHVGIEA